MDPTELAKLTDEELERNIAASRPNSYVPGSSFHAYIAEQEKRRYQKLLDLAEGKGNASKGQGKKKISSKVIKMLFANSGNKCAFPNCSVKLTENGVVSAHIAHIEAEKPGGPRYNKDQSDNDRFGYDNLILLCPTHHNLVDKDPTTYTVEVLKEYKQSSLAYEGKATLTVTFKTESATGSKHIYVLEVTLKNNSSQSINKPKMKITLPEEVVEVFSSRGIKEVIGNSAEIYFEELEVEAIYPGEEKKLMETTNVGLHYFMNSELHNLPQVMAQELKVELYADNFKPILSTKPFKEMQEF